MERRQKQDYERPTMQVVELRHRTMILAGSTTGSTGTPTYNGFNGEYEWDE